MRCEHGSLLTDMGLGFWGLNVLFNLPRPAVWHGGLEPEEYSLRACGLPPLCPLSAVTGRAGPGCSHTPASHRLPCRVCASCGALTPAWELVWGVREEKELLRGGLEEGPMGWALRQRQGAWTGHGGAGLGRRGCWTRLLGRESVGPWRRTRGRSGRRGWLRSTSKTLLGTWVPGARSHRPAQFQGCSYSGFLLHPGRHTSTTQGASWQKHQNIKSKPRRENQHRGLQKTHQGAELCWCFSASVFVSFSSLCVFYMTHSTAVLHSASSLTKGPSLSTSRMIFLVKISCVMR